MNKNISSSNCVKKDNTGQVTCLKLPKGRGGGGGVLVNDISQVAPSNIFKKTKDDAALALHTALQFFKLVL